MNVDVHVQLGIKGLQRRVGSVFLDARSVGTASTWAGSYHVLVMGRHYDDYVVTSRTIGLPQVQGIPPAHPYERLTGKIRAAGVTGNIGEAIAAVVARRHLGARIEDVAHVRPRRPFRRRKAPDYLMRIGSRMPGVFSPVLPSGAVFAWPDWWPVESKARTTGSACDRARREALGQLKAYWSLLAAAQPAVVGFGLVVAYAYQPPRRVVLSLIVPRDRTRLVSEFRTRNERDVTDEMLRATLHAC
jgi:hypothetical protein